MLTQPYSFTFSLLGIARQREREKERQKNAKSKNRIPNPLSYSQGGSSHSQVVNVFINDNGTVEWLLSNSNGDSNSNENFSVSLLSAE